MVPPGIVEVLDADSLDLTMEQALGEIEAGRPRIVGMTVTTATVEIVAAFTQWLAARGIPTVLGGPYATLAPLELLGRCPDATYVVCGDGEGVFPAIVERVLAGSPLEGLPGVWSRDHRGSVRAAGRLELKDMKQAAMPRLEGLPVARYWCPDARMLPMVTASTSRGCPHRCAFCSSPRLYGRKVRFAPVSNVLDWLESIVEMYGIREVSFVDDGFTLNPKRTVELCQGMVERELGLSWFCNARADEIAPDVARTMAKAGCHQVYLGFESGSQKVLDAIHKDCTVEALVRGAEILKDAGIDRSIGFIVGLPGETEATVEATKALATHVRPERIQFSRFTAIPGSELAPLTSTDSQTFHGKADDQVGRWQAQLYAQCRGEGWGAASL
jgi:radical SAM superfamily enzyme YgiQ (UPF0313 family)